MKLKVLKNEYAIYRFITTSNIPEEVYGSDFYSITKTEDEISIVCNALMLSDKKIKRSINWKILKIIGPLDLSLVGIIADISKILSENKITLFAISTYETDYILVKNIDLIRTIDVLNKNGYIIRGDNI